MADSRTVQFGDLLRQHRMAAGLTQEALAERAGLSVHGVQKLERGVTRPYRDTVQRLVSGLELGDEEAERLRAAGAPQPRHRFGQAGAPWRFDMPVELTSFVGRESELARLTEQLPSVRLLTLVGPGGVGKTRLAARLGSRLMDRFRDGAALVGLGNLSDPQTVPNAVATGLGITERGRTPLRMSLLEALRDRALLLVIDNCEHVLDGCTELAHDILVTCPGVTLLSTSREPLRVSGEVTWPVPPLSLDSAEVSTAATSEAVQLFVERARTVDPQFHLDPANRQAVIGICRHLEGLPLAIELAAARVRSMPARRLLEDLQASSGVLPLLTGGPRDAPIRQQTLRATIAWSYELLSAEEQALFRRLAPFRGCTLAAVDAVCSTPSLGSRGATLALTSLNLDARVGLESLVNRSLLRLEEDEQGQPWYVMLETVREFALEQLAATHEADAVWRRHTWYCLQLAKLSAPVLEGMRQSHQVRRLERELGNFRVALDWCQHHGYADASLRLAVDLLWLWGARGHIAEGRSRLEALLERFPLRTAHAPRVLVHASALQAVGRLATLQRDFGAAFAYQQQSLELSEASGDAGSMCDALYGLGFAAHEQGDYAAAQKYLDRGVALCRSLAASNEATTMFRLGQGLVGLGVLAHDQGDDHAALALFGESTIWFERAGDTVSVALNNVELGAIAQEGATTSAPASLSSAGSGFSSRSTSRVALGSRSRAWLMLPSPSAISRPRINTWPAVCRSTRSLASQPESPSYWSDSQILQRRRGRRLGLSGWPVRPRFCARRRRRSSRLWFSAGSRSRSLRRAGLSDAERRTPSAMVARRLLIGPSPKRSQPTRASRRVACWTI